MTKQAQSLIILLSAALSAHGQRLEVGWPTPNPAYFEGRSITEFIQPTAAGEPESGLYGCRRSGGRQFHEGLDLKPVKRDRRGEPADPVFAAMNGVVRYISRTPGNSNYGRYVVLEHPDADPAVYTLYAHLADVAPGLSPGMAVTRGQTLGLMGRSSSEQAIPRERGHLHFEMGVVLSQNFESWYDWKKFGSRNMHGNYNGMNLVGFDPMEFFDEYRARRVDNFREFFAHMRTAVRLRVAMRGVPDYVRRYPSLMAKPLPDGQLVGGWEVRVNEMGVPFSFTPLTPMDLMNLGAGEVRLLEVDEDLLRHHRCKSLAVARRGEWRPGRDLQEVLQLVFGLR